MTAAAFWKRVKRCKHEATSNYLARVSCGHESLGCAGGSEWHCKKCGVYVTDDPCGGVSGMSGWPYSRWKKHDGGIWSPAKWSRQA